MTIANDDVARAREEAAAARRRLLGTLAQVQGRLQPTHLAQDALDGAKQGLVTATHKGVEAARRRPAALVGAAGAVALFLARGWIGRRLSRRDETHKPDKGLKSKRA